MSFKKYLREVYDKDGDYLHPEKYPEGWEEVIKRIRIEIGEALSQSNPETYRGIHFSDVGAGGIQIGLNHVKFPNSGFAPFQARIVTLKYDLSNADEVIEDAIRKFKLWDNPKTILDIEDMNRSFARYGTH